MIRPHIVRRLATASFFYFAAFDSNTHFTSARESPTSSSGMSAGKLRSLGEVAMSERKFEEAASYYKSAIEVEPKNAVNYFKLFRVHSRMRDLANALKDITDACENDPQNEEYRLQKAKLLVSLGQCEEALANIQIAMNGNNSNSGDLVNVAAEATQCASDLSQANEAYAEEEWDIAVHYFERVMHRVEQASDILFMKAQAQHNAGDYYGSVSDTGKILKTHKQHIAAYQLRGNSYFRLGEHETAVNHYREGLKLDPEHKGCKEGHKHVKTIMKKDKRGDDAFAKGEFQKALDYWWEAMNFDISHLAFVRPTLLKVVEAHVALKQFDKAIEEAQKHIDNEETVDGLIALGDAQIAADKFQDAVNTFRKANDFEPNARQKETAQKLKKAEIALKQSKEKNYYKILGIPRNAKKKDIKSAYRELALKWHPDKNKDNVEEAKKMFQDIGEAYEVLYDDELRSKYDRGEQVFENQGGGGGGHQFNHQDIFRHFQHGGGGGGGRGRGGGGGRTHHFHFG
mmetsp:Transcript_1756/g.2520  ORF Transcript_1756/g.2520 Transcript_1756/m.2520 type:complete len:514 (+) Transcript_1756:137-1678(+)|eukprot:CAMPEP_0184866192 /NCGR_PEP_ID=MMETSP0580-20130426/21254_1 /TAXON_ID=1118495 /ORGANISM="Dactyliosolen fragilissimus" /LENGTH=513 /DNA_ID=CAMNT_0027365727 /DNA_START=26 /DNA_END=1567 /DNA_ORIENTATION=+